MAEERKSIAYLASSETASYSAATTMVTDPSCGRGPLTALGIERPATPGCAVGRTRVCARRPLLGSNDGPS
jgi:hypothetical protein